MKALILRSAQFTRVFFHLFLETGTLPHVHPFSLNHSETCAHKREHRFLTCYQIRNQEMTLCEKVQAGKGKMQ